MDIEYTYPISERLERILNVWTEKAPQDDHYSCTHVSNNQYM